MASDARRLEGVIVPLITPLNEKEELDAPALEKLIEHVMEAKVHALMALGSTGEFASLTGDVKEAVMRKVKEIADGKIPVFVNVSDISTKRAIKGAKIAESIGCNAIVVCPPYFYYLNQESLIEHYERIAEAVSLPIILYNIPQYIISELNIETVKKLSKNKGIIGIKDSSGNTSYLENLAIHFRNAPFRIYQGDERNIEAALMTGANGFVPSIANLYPQLCVDLYNAFKEDNGLKIHDLQETIRSFGNIYGLTRNKIQAGLKYALSLKGICRPIVSEPLPELDKFEKFEIERIMQQYDIRCKHTAKIY